MILETKIQLPQTKPGIVARRGLLDLLKNNLDKKLVLIAADAGYGKTTLLAQLIKEARLPAVFYDMTGNFMMAQAYMPAVCRHIVLISAAVGQHIPIGTFVLGPGLKPIQRRPRRR
ncbi:MAG: hypothetical protein QME74_11635 [Candidatus Edwardsbacteria bacterium]|nr:hypothetical protein [Candidatus Edwardsbacteria bacterium]